ncbi:MAG TPA: hypothetical protein VFB43_09230 [Terracidiphilus sp.]|nr:hypothetical protein [Terracidiphilus sp.]
MVDLLAVFIVFVFLAAGSVAFLACILVPPGRKYALSTALWFATWGPCCAVLPIMALLGMVADNLVLQETHMHWKNASELFAIVGRAWIIVGGIVTCGLASFAAWLHQALIHRTTFLLFRLYATFVVAGIGAVLSLFSFWFAMNWDRFSRVWWLAAPVVPALIVVFGATAYRHARALRGSAPANFTWITPDEFAGPVQSHD